MSIRRVFHVAIILLAVAFLRTPFSDVHARQVVREKPKIKDFGKSLRTFGATAENKTPAAGDKPSVEESRDGDEEILKVKTTLVLCDVMITDKKGRPVEGLTRDDFLVIEDGAPQKIETFAPGDAASVPRTIVLIIDYSASQYPFIKTSVAAAKTLIDQLNPHDRMAIVTDDVSLMVDFTRDKQELKEALDLMERKTRPNGFSDNSGRFGKSQQYSALLAAFNEAIDEEDERPIIIFQTDGDELFFLRDAVFAPPVSATLAPAIQDARLKFFAGMQEMYRKSMRAFSLKDVQQAAERTRATIYTVVPGYRLTGLTPGEQVERVKAIQLKRIESANSSPESIRGLEERLKKAPSESFLPQAYKYFQEQSALEGVTEITGGWTDFLETPEQAAEIYSRILHDINRRYLLGYYPTNGEPDGRRRQVKVEVRNHPEYVVRGRKSYLAARE